MGKGLHVSTMLYLIIAVIILILFAPILIRSAGAVWNQILQGLGLAAPSSAFEKAVECSYYRCVEGCLSYKVMNEIKWHDGEREVWCNEFCGVPEEFRPDNKICGWNAMQYPVEINSKIFSPEKKYSKKIGEISFTCVTPLDTPQSRDMWNYISKGTIAGTFIVTACVGVAKIYLPAALVTCPAAWVVSLIWREASYDHLLLAPEFIETREVESCKLPPDIGGPVYPESLKEFTLKPLNPTDLNPEGLVYIFTDREVGGTFNPGDRRVVGALSIPTYMILPQKEEKQVQLVRDNWNRIYIKGIGDVLVKPDVLSYYTDTGIVEVFYGVDIKCPDGTLSENQLINMDDCKKGGWFCEDQFFIKCIDVLDVKRLTFGLSYGITPPGVELFEHPNFEGSWIKIIRDKSNLKALNNIVSSIKLPPGWKAILYDLPDFKGKNITIAGNSTYLVHCKDPWQWVWPWQWGWCPAYVSSIKFDESGCSAIIYSEEEYRGESRRITENIKNLADLGWDDKIKSIKVSSGCKAILYEHPYFEGRNVTVSDSSSKINFDDTAESIKVIPPKMV